MAVGQFATSAYKTASTWGTAASINAATLGVYINDESLNPVRQVHPNDGPSLTMPVDSADSIITADGSITQKLRYHGQCMQMLADAMGADDVTGLGLPPDAYKHVLRIADNPKFGTFGIVKGSKVLTTPSIKPSGFAITCPYPGYATLAINYLGLPYNNTLNANLNTVTFVDAADNPTKNLVMYAQHCVLEIAAWSGGALPDISALAAKSFKFNGFTFTFDRPINGDNFIGNTVTINEPEPTGTTNAKLTVNFATLITGAAPAHDDIIALIQELIDSAGIYCGRITWDNQILIPGTSRYYRMQVVIPRMKNTDAAQPVSGAGKIPATLNFQCDGNTSANTGASWDANAFNDMFYVEVDNPYGTDYVI
jgi:hypothetical protein